MEMSANIRQTAEQYFKETSDSTRFIFKSLLNVKIRQKQLYSRRLNTLPNDIIVTIDYKTDIKGYFSFFFSVETALRICEKLVPGIEKDIFTEDHLDILGELGNMISGNTIGKLQLINDNFRMDSPQNEPFAKILTSEKDFWHFSSNYELDEGRMGLLLAMKKGE